MGWESSHVVRFDLVGQIRITKPKSAFYLFIIRPRGLQSGLQSEPSYRKSWAGNVLMRSNLTLGPLSGLNEDTQT